MAGRTDYYFSFKGRDYHWRVTRKDGVRWLLIECPNTMADNGIARMCPPIRLTGEGEITLDFLKQAARFIRQRPGFESVRLMAQSYYCTKTIQL